MIRQMWFGTRGFERWVKSPVPGGDTSKVGFTSGVLQYLDGGAGLRASQAAHREYNWSWPNTTSRAEMRQIVDYAEGVYDSVDGVNLIHFLDPMAMDQNLLPQWWATPALGGSDGLPLIADAEPTMVSTPANALDYPARGARYTFGAGFPASVYIPIPPGHVAWVGVHGEATGGATVQATQVAGYAAGATTAVPLQAVTDQARVTTPISPSAGKGGVLLSLQGSAGATITLYGMMVQVLEAGAQPQAGGFISGQGHSGCLFAGQPAQTPYSSVFDQTGFAAKLIEVGGWL